MGLCNKGLYLKAGIRLSPEFDSMKVALALKNTVPARQTPNRAPFGGRETIENTDTRKANKCRPKTGGILRIRIANEQGSSVTKRGPEEGAKLEIYFVPSGGFQ